MKHSPTYRPFGPTALGLLAALLFSGCQQTDDRTASRQPIRFSAQTVAAVTRSANDSQNDCFDEGTHVTVYPYKGTTTTLTDPVYGAAFPANGIDYQTVDRLSGNIYTLSSTVPDPSFPQDNGGKVTIVSVHPRVSETTYTGSTPSYTFTVRADQSAPADYKASDLMVVKKEATQTADAIPLQYSHRLAKVSITFQSDAGTPKVCKVEILRVKPSVTVNVQTAAVGTASGTDTDIVCYNTAEGTTALTTVSAVVPAQTAKAAGTAFVRFTFFGGGSISWPLVEAVTLAAGKHYQYNLRVGLKSVGTLNTVVTDWNADGSAETSTEHIVEV